MWLSCTCLRFVGTCRNKPDLRKAYKLPLTKRGKGDLCTCSSGSHYVTVRCCSAPTKRRQKGKGVPEAAYEVLSLGEGFAVHLDYTVRLADKLCSITLHNWRSGALLGKTCINPPQKGYAPYLLRKNASGAAVDNTDGQPALQKFRSCSALNRAGNTAYSHGI